MTDYKKLGNQPLVIALAEFRFSSVLGMKDHVSLLQENLRHDFPLFDEMQEQNVTVSPKGVEVKSATGWVFKSSNQKEAIILSDSRLTVITSAYNRYPDFWDKCRKALMLLIENVNPTLLTRVGLRYSDAIFAKEENEPIETYVKAIIHENCFAKSEEQIRRSSESVLKTSAGIIVIRSLYGKVNLPVWPDLIGTHVLFNRNKSVSNTILLDFDHFWKPEEGSQNFELEFIENKMQALHQISREEFFNIITEEGKEVWS